MITTKYTRRDYDNANAVQASYRHIQYKYTRRTPVAVRTFDLSRQELLTAASQRTVRTQPHICPWAVWLIHRRRSRRRQPKWCRTCVRKLCRCVATTRLRLLIYIPKRNGIIRWTSNARRAFMHAGISTFSRRAHICILLFHILRFFHVNIVESTALCYPLWHTHTNHLLSIAAQNKIITNQHDNRLILNAANSRHQTWCHHDGSLR